MIQESQPPVKNEGVDLGDEDIRTNSQPLCTLDQDVNTSA